MPNPKRAVWSAAVAIVALATAIRVYGVNSRSLWLDEVLSSQATAYDSLSDLMAWVKSWIDLMPAYPLITWLLRAFGNGEVALRMPSVVAGIVAVFAIFMLAKSLFGPTIGLTSASILAVLPFAVWFSQEARTYALFMLVTILQMLFVYRARSGDRLIDWAAFSACTGMNLYTHYLAITVTAAAYLYLAVGLIADAVGGKWSIRQGLRATASAAVVVLAYLPWLHLLRTFLRSGNTALSRYQGISSGASLGQLRLLLESVSFWGVLLAALAIGLIALVLRLRGNRDESLLILLWLGLPLGGLLIVLRTSTLYLSPRYFSFLIPAAVITAAVGIEATARIVYSAARRVMSSRPARLQPMLSAAVAALVVISIVPALAAPQPQPHQDYRGAVDYLIAHSPPNSMVLALGQDSPWVVLGFSYYLHRRGSEIALVDGGAVDNLAAKQLLDLKGTVWAALTFASAEEAASARASGMVVNSTFETILLVRNESTLPPIDQAQALLRWDSAAQPAFASSIDVIGAVTGVVRLGPNLLDQAAQWTLSSGASTSGGAFTLTPVNNEVNVTATLTKVEPGARYLFDFHYREDGSQGYQRTYVVAEDPAGHPLGIFPTGAGYSCGSAKTWREGLFGFTVPAGTARLGIWLRAVGSGTAEFDGLAVQRVL
jgi:hypothetical protein